LSAIKPRMQPITRTGVCDKWHPGVPAEIIDKVDDTGMITGRECRRCRSIRTSRRKNPRGAAVKPLAPYGVVRLDWIPPERIL